METKEKLQYLPVTEVKAKGNFLKAIGFKPKLAPILCAIAGIALLLPSNLYARLLGAFIIVLSLAVLALVKDYKVMDIFDQGIMFYGDKEAKLACFLPFEEIRMWKMDRENGHDTIEFTLTDESKIFKDTFEADRAYRILYSLIREKEENYIRMKKNRETSLSIPEAFERLKQRMFKK